MNTHAILAAKAQYRPHRHWRHTDFNLMGLGHLAGQRQGPVQRWEDNRIGFTEDCVWRYDPCGNRIAQMHADHSQQQLHYDGAHQLIAVRSSQIQGNAEQLRHHSRYTYDALGRRLKQQVESADPTTPTRTHYYGWDGDRLIHTERLQHGDDTRHIEHTIYEPGSFTPLVRLSTTASGDPQDEPHFLVQAIAAGLPDQHDPSNAQGLSLMQNMLDAMPRDMQQEAARHLRHALEHGLPASAQAILGEQAESTARMLGGMQAKLQEQEKAQHARIAIHHYHCDHLGTPMALTDQRGLVTWAAKLDPWGNVLQEYNPQGIHQAIRLPGQHHDRETGLYYNRHRYYDPVVGSYINQDPIGLMGGNNHYIYPVNPTGWIDSLGLQQACVVNFPDYPVEYAEGKTSTWLGGHSGVLTYDTSGKTQYFEYGRYNPNAKGIMGSKLPQDDGNVRQTPMPNLKIGKDGVPTDDSMRNLEEQLSKRSGKGTPAKLTCSSADPKKVADYAKEISENKDREKYNWNPFNSNHCRTFARDAAKAGQ